MCDPYPVFQINNNISGESRETCHCQYHNMCFNMFLVPILNFKKQEFTVYKGHYVRPNNIVEYTSWPIILRNMKAIGQTTKWSGTDERKNICPHTIVGHIKKWQTLYLLSIHGSEIWKQFHLKVIGTNVFRLNMT